MAGSTQTSASGAPHSAAGEQPVFFYTHKPAIHEDRERGIFRVHRRAFTDPAVLERERSEIFARCWLYAAHESELAQSGAFISRSVGGRPLLLTRDKSGALNVFFNACRHRGALVCREDKGRARNFTCPYHGWVYGDDGKLLMQPIPDSYSDHCKHDPELDLQRVPRVEVYAGFIFVSYAAQGESLREHLADAADYLDMVAQQGPKGMEVVGGTQKYCAHANWKLLQENSVDGYHAESTHGTYLAYIKNREGTVRNNYGGRFGQVLDLKNGHAVSESVNGTPWGRPSARWVESWGPAIKQQIDATYREMSDRLGEERATLLCHGDRNLLIFPNLIINDVAGLTLRVVYPVSPGYFEVNAWAMAAIDEPAEIRELRLRNYVEFLGPGGLATPDDQEMLELCQRGYETGLGDEWNDLSRGMDAEVAGQPASKMDEFQLRTFWRRWAEVVGAGKEAA
jgi:p-cumate 2,3-dioxygenase alpha subunit